MQLTSNYKLKKPEGSDVVNVQDFNDNADILDNIIKTHNHDDRYYTESEINSKINTINNSINGKANSNHNHDDRYYTESEINSKINTINNSINGKANSNHNHDDRYYTEDEINSKINTINNNIGQLSNPNLLINGDFQVWQRGTSFNFATSHGYCADRWHCRNTATNATITINKDGNGCKLNIKNYESDKIIGIYQYLETDLSKKLIGTTVTLTVDIANITGHWKAVFQMKESPFNTYGYIQELKVGKNIVTGTITTLQNLALYIRGYSDGSITIKSIKLELGSVATSFVSRPYAEELALCQRYYQRFHVPQIAVPMDSTFDSRIPLIPDSTHIMRINKPTAIFSTNVYAHDCSSASTTWKLASKGDSFSIPREQDNSLWLNRSNLMSDEDFRKTYGFPPAGTLVSYNLSEATSNRISGAVWGWLDAELY